MSEQPFRDSVVANLAFCRQRLLTGVTALAPDDHDFQPVPTLMSARQQLRHVAWGERFWRACATGAPPPAPLAGEAEPWDAVLAELAAQRQATLAWAGQLADLDLLRAVSDPQGRPLSVIWVLHHLARHDAHHAGQLIALWRERHPDGVIPSGYARVLDALNG